MLVMENCFKVCVVLVQSLQAVIWAHTSHNDIALHNIAKIKIFLHSSFLLLNDFA